MSLDVSTRKLVNSDNVWFFYSFHVVKEIILELHFIENETNYIIERINSAKKFNNHEYKIVL